MVNCLISIFTFVEKHTDVFTLLLAVIGGTFALSQWITQVKHKRDEIVRDLICKVRDDEDISSIMDVIDWDEGILYDGKFSISPKCRSRDLKELDGEKLFKKIDKTLSHFSYVCYLEANKTLGKKDIAVFEYELRRIVDNEHIRNYLYSLYHWSKYLRVKCSFEYLIQYSIERKYLKREFRRRNSKCYECYLRVPT